MASFSTAKKLVLSGLGLGLLSVVGGEMPGATLSLPIGYAEGARLRRRVDNEAAVTTSWRQKAKKYAGAAVSSANPFNWKNDISDVRRNGRPSQWQPAAITDSEQAVVNAAKGARNASARAFAKRNAVRNQDYDTEVDNIMKERNITVEGDEGEVKNVRSAIREAIIVGEEKLYTYEHDLAKKWESIWSLVRNMFYLLIVVYVVIVAFNHGEWLPCGFVNAHVLDDKTKTVETSTSPFCVAKWGNGHNDGNCFDGSSSWFGDNVEFATDGFVGGASGVQTVTVDLDNIEDTYGNKVSDPNFAPGSSNTGVVALPASYGTWSTNGLPSSTNASV